jgi:hypothetical protein
MLLLQSSVLIYHILFHRSITRDGSQTTSIIMRAIWKYVITEKSGHKLNKQGCITELKYITHKETKSANT